MSVFNNRDIKRLFVALVFVLVLFIGLSQLYFWISYGALNVIQLLLSLLLGISFFSGCYLYFRKQQQTIENAISQINLFLTRDTNTRIECDNEGDLYKLFHAINTLATTLAAEATREQKMKEFLKDTISDISHQLKTPLAALNIYNSLLQDESEDINSMKEFSVKSERELDRIDMLVQNLLKITKLDAGTIIMDRHTENITDMMNDIQQQFETRADKEKKIITVSGSVDIELLCDRVWLLEAVSNVVKNALDHTAAGSNITIEWNRLPAVTQITVKDNGSGIHTEDIHHIFKRFYRSRFSKDTHGLGLGLPLTKAIVEAHDGNITADSILGKGSTFTMNFLNLTKL